MPKIILTNVMNRWWEGHFFAYTGALPPTSTIDEIHRRIRDKCTFFKYDLNAIISHYTTADPKGIKKHATEINNLYRLLDTIGVFNDLVPQPNQDFVEPLSGGLGGGYRDTDDWYDPNIIYGSTTNHESTVDVGKRDGYIDLLRYDNQGHGRIEDTGYEIEFSYDVEYVTITLADQPA